MHSFPFPVIFFYIIGVFILNLIVFPCLSKFFKGQAIALLKAFDLLLGSLDFEPQQIFRGQLRGKVKTFLAG